MEDYTAEMIKDMAFSFCPQCGTAIVPNHKGSWSMNTSLEGSQPQRITVPKRYTPRKGAVPRIRYVSEIGKY